MNPAVRQLLLGKSLDANIRRNGAGLTKYRAALAKVRAGGRARLLVVGDSTTVGAGAGTGTGNLSGARPLSYCSRLASYLTTLGIPAYSDALVGDQNVNATLSYATYDSRVTATSWAPANFGVPGKNIWRTTTSGANLAFTPSMTFDRFDIITANANGLGSFDVNVDGGSTIATINTSNATSIAAKTTVSCTRGTHTINLTSTGTAACNVVAIIPWDSTTGGLDIIQAGWYGAKMSDLATNTDQWQSSNPVVLGLLGADIAILQATINDSVAGTIASTYSAQLATVDAALAGSGAAVLLMTGIPSDTAIVPADAQAAIIEAARARAQAQSYVLADLASRCGSYAIINAMGWMADDKHGNAALYADEANWLAKNLMNLGA